MKNCLRIRNKSVFAVLAVCAMLLFSAGCSEYSRVNEDYYAGETVDSMRLQEIYESLSDAEAATESERETNSDGENIVFWLDGGSVWHIDRECRYINGKEVESGDENQAEEAGMERVCSGCGG